MKMIMLIQHAEKKENSSSKRYEMSKCSFGDAILVTDCNILFTVTLYFISIEIPDDAQINHELYTFSNSFDQEPNYNLTLQIYASFAMCVSFLLLLLQIICQIDGATLDMSFSQLHVK